ncbi:MAG TPA: sigma-70 family RNA polymerase sigma factor [Candidatus Micrarchaeia archaeon]|nr:sigma-70 family RNA polymerase sigma factor [Candidatus Micrarchaeia archaeon]
MSPRADDDARLIDLAKRDPEAFGALYDRYVTQIYRFASARLRNPAAAEDVTSEVFFKALRALPRYRSTGHPFSAWLYQIAANAIADHHRGRRHPETDLEEAGQLAEGGPGLEDTVLARAEAKRVWVAIDALPEQQRMAMTLKYAEDLRLAEIGIIMGKSEGAIKLLIHRGTRSVRAALLVGQPGRPPIQEERSL